MHVVCFIDESETKVNSLDMSFGESAVYDQFVVECLSKDKKFEELTVRNFRINNNMDGQSRMIMHFHYSSTLDELSDRSIESMIRLVGLVQQSYQMNPHGNIVVYCASGVGKTGVFIGLNNMIEQMRVENAVDVFHNVLEMRCQRGNMIQTKQQYLFCYQAMHNYLKSFHFHQNAT